jgi:hypothetical protein
LEFVVHCAPSRLTRWIGTECRTKEEGVWYEFIVKTPQHSITSVDPAENEWWRVFSDTTQKLGLEIETEIFPAGSVSSLSSLSLSLSSCLARSG